MLIRIPHRLLTHKAPNNIDAPWLSGRGTKWMVASDWVVIADGKRFTVPAGYCFDGASIPWFVWWLFPPTYSPAWEASCLHDWFYSHQHHTVSKPFADDAFKAVMLKQGASPWIAKLFHAAVSKFGRGGW